jgi:hypothetical protein
MTPKGGFCSKISERIVKRSFTRRRQGFGFALAIRKNLVLVNRRRRLTPRKVQTAPIVGPFFAGAPGYLTKDLYLILRIKIGKVFDQYWKRIVA